MACTFVSYLRGFIILANAEANCVSIMFSTSSVESPDLRLFRGRCFLLLRRYFGSSGGDPNFSSIISFTIPLILDSRLASSLKNFVALRVSDPAEYIVISSTSED